MLMRDDAVKILEAAGMTRLQASQFCGRGKTITIDAVCRALRIIKKEQG